MTEELLRLVKDAYSLQSRLVFVVGGNAQQRRVLLADVASRFDTQPAFLGIDYARRMAAMARRQRPIQASAILLETVDLRFSTSAPAVLDRIEVLFDSSLSLDVFSALRRLSHSRTVVASWPGELRDRRLTYAPRNHPEHCDHPVAGFLVYQLS